MVAVTWERRSAREEEKTCTLDKKYTDKGRRKCENGADVSHEGNRDRKNKT